MTKIVEVPDIEWKYRFTCNKCGGHAIITSVLNAAQLSSPFIGWSVGRICQNCRNVIEITDKPFMLGAREGPIKISDFTDRND
jgi:hypothetical protein